ncbi:MAG: serine/threonine protein kinase [Myxococcales bacterium]|nr:serine/threonine protein kinase [Myxococcales bacterium]
MSSDPTADPIAGRLVATATSLDLAHDATITPELLRAATLDAGPVHSASALLSQSLRLPTLAVATAETAAARASGPRVALDLELGAVLGEGGMGRVLAAQQCALRREVAVKLLRAGEETPARVDALLGEALTMGRLEHPNIVPVYALGQTESRAPLLVMRRISGVTWRALMQDPAHAFFGERARDRDRLGAHLEVLARLCDAVDYAHSCGVIHRDIKPDNVMLGEFGEVYLVDWGIALDAAVETGAPDVLVGTPAYMAPEMTRGDSRRVDARTDVYLLGACLYELLSGEPPHSGATLLDVLRAAQRTSPLTLPPSVPDELAAIVQRATAPAPEERFASARALRRALTRFQEHRSSLEISAAARERLERLRALASAVTPSAQREQGDELQACCNECLFGFRLALREWPGNADARGGLRACLEVMLRVELTRRDLEAARRLLAQLDGPREALREQVEVLADAIARERADVEEMQAMRRDLDLGRDARARARVFAFACACGLAVTAAIWIARARGGDVTLSHAMMIALAGALVVAYAGVIWWWRRRVLSTLINRRLVLLMGFVLFALVLSRAVGLLLDTPAPTMLAGDLLQSGCLVIASALVVHRALLLPGVAFILGAYAVALWPRWHFELFNTAIVVASCATVLALQSLTAGAPATDGEP